MSPVIASREERHYLGKKKEEEEEIGVFSAEKYFNGAMDDCPRLTKVASRKYNYITDEQLKASPVKTKIQIRTPSVRSKSSCNNQSALLQSALRNLSRKFSNKVQGKSYFAGLQCKCSCSDKNSIDIDEHFGETSFRKMADSGIGQGKPITIEPNKPGNLIDKVHVDKSGFAKEDLLLNKESCFNFHTRSSTTGNLPSKVHFEEEEEDEIKPRKSLEVFVCPEMGKRNKSPGLKSSDAAPRLDDIKFSVTPGESFADGDASSDLFEIENLTGEVKNFLARQGSDSATPTAYAPTEASIEWSMVTASAADCLMTPDYKELRPPKTSTSPVRSFSVTLNARTCIVGRKSQKAVRAAGEPYRTTEKANYDLRVHRISEFFTPVTRFQAEAKLTGSDSKQRQHDLAAVSSLPRSHSPHSSHLLYI